MLKEEYRNPLVLRCFFVLLDGDKGLYLYFGTLRIYSWEVLSRKKQSSSEVRGRPIVSDSSSTLRSSAFWRRKGGRGKEGRTLASLPSAFFVILRYRLPTPRLLKQKSQKGERRNFCASAAAAAAASAATPRASFSLGRAARPPAVRHQSPTKKGERKEIIRKRRMGEGKKRRDLGYVWKE